MNIDYTDLQMLLETENLPLMTEDNIKKTTQKEKNALSHTLYLVEERSLRPAGITHGNLEANTSHSLLQCQY